MLFVKGFILPPGINIIIALLGIYIVWRRRRKRRSRIGISLVLFAILSLYFFSTPLVAEWLMHPLVDSYAPVQWQNLTEKTKARAIVVISSGKVFAPEYEGVTVSPITLERVRYASRLARQTKLPILVAGGSNIPGRESDASLMARVLEEDFQVPVRWLEDRSTNTYQNALYTAEILKNHDVKTFYLVTNVWHMRRAMWAFQHVGLDPIPAPTGYFELTRGRNIYRVLPSARALHGSQLALHEYIGYWWYQFRY